MRAGSSILISLTLFWFGVMVGGAHGAEVTELNDSTTGGEPSTVFASFLPGESIASWLTASCTGDIVAAQVYWKSQFGGGPALLEQSISIFAPGVHPAPGAALTNAGGGNAVVVGPTLTDGVMNEYRFLDPPTNATALSVPVTMGQQFVVALKFFNQSSGGGPFTPAPTADQDGCQPLTNAVDVIPGGWLDACPQGVTGDWVIRAVIDCQAAQIPSANDWSALALGTTLAAVGLIAATTLARRRVGVR